MKEATLAKEQGTDLLTSAECKKAMTYKCEAEQKKAEGLYTDAVELYEKGIAALGDSHYSTDVLDDTGMRVILAEMNEKQGKHEAAAHLLHSVLASRIDSALQVQTQKRKRN